MKIQIEIDVDKEHCGECKWLDYDVDGTTCTLFQEKLDYDIRHSPLPERCELCETAEKH
jgi:hypothetical protein